VVNPHNVETDLAHKSKIGIDLLGSSKIILVSVGPERPVSNSFNKKLSVAFEKEFRDWANSRVCCPCHVERSRDISQCFLV
jgi:hypothetical protein